MTMPPLKLLLVEDNRADAVLLQDLLQDTGGANVIDLTWADRLEKALTRLRAESFTAILLDLSLPDSRGLATLDRVHEIAGAVPIVILSGFGDEEMALQAIRQGAQEYLVKGTVDGRAILRAVRHAIDRKQGEEALRRSEETARLQLAEIEAYYGTAPIGLAVLDPGLRFVRINRHLAAINGHSVETHLGRTLHEMAPVLAAKTEALFRQVLATGLPLLDFEISGETPSRPGEPRTWRASFHPLHDLKGRVAGVNAVVQEITELKRF